MGQKFFTFSRYILGFVFFVFGGAGLFKLMPQPEGLPENMVMFMKGFEASVYFMPFLKLTEMVCGLMLLARIAPALALVILAPISINIFFTHMFLTPGLSNLVMPVAILVFHIAAMMKYKEQYFPLFRRL